MCWKWKGRLLYSTYGYGITSKALWNYFTFLIYHSIQFSVGLKMFNLEMINYREAILLLQFIIMLPGETRVLHMHITWLAHAHHMYRTCLAHVLLMHIMCMAHYSYFVDYMWNWPPIRVVKLIIFRHTWHRNAKAPFIVREISYIFAAVCLNLDGVFHHIIACVRLHTTRNQWNR